MSQLDGLIQDLAIQKHLFFVFVGVALTTLGWVATNPVDPGEQWSNLRVSAIFVTVGASLFAWTRFRRMYQLIQEIKDV